MRRTSNKHSKLFNVSLIVLEIAFEIILLPFHIITAIGNIYKEIKR